MELVRSGLREYARGYHVYKDICEASIGEQLLCQWGNGNCADLFAVMPVCQESTLGSSVFEERYWLALFSVGCASAFYTALFTSSFITRRTA